MNDVEEKWRLNASRLTSKQIGTRLWNEFKDALSCLQEGDDESVEAWVDETEVRFIASYEKFEADGFSNPSPDLDNRARAAQTLLLEGVESWLAAFEALRESAPRDVILSKAEWGQRLLIAVQHLKKEEPAPVASLEIWGF